METPAPPIESAWEGAALEPARTPAHPESRSRPRTKTDGFGTTPQSGRGLLGGAELRAPVRTVRELIPPKLAALPDREAVAKRFAADFALLEGQLRPRSLPTSERVARVWAFFMAYAEAAAAHAPHAQSVETFLQTLEEQGLAPYKDAETGEAVLELAHWVLSAPTPKEARQRGEPVHLEPPPEAARPPEDTTLPKQAPASEEKQAPRAPRELRDSAFTPATDSPPSEPREEFRETAPLTLPKQAAPSEERPLPRAPREARDSAFTPATDSLHAEPTVELSEKASLAAPSSGEATVRLPGAPPPHEQRGPAEEVADVRTSGTGKRLGPQMLWNVLHRFRASPEESALTEAQWDRLTFGAMLALVGIALVGVLLLTL